MMSYDEGRRVIHLRNEMKMCGQSVDASADVCVMTGAKYLLIVQKDNVPKPRLCASKIC